MTAVVDYDAGNIRSVLHALDRAGAGDVVLSADPEVLTRADRVILPGVGDASVALRSLQASGLGSVILSLKQPVLGICVGMQLLCRHTDEGDVDTLGVFGTDVHRFVPAPGLKVPHMGWNAIEGLRGPLFKGIPEESAVYFVHSFYAGVCPDTVASCSHGTPFSAALAKDNFFGTQFHPEKSGAAGAAILKNFLAL